MKFSEGELIIMNNEAIQAKMVKDDLEEKYKLAYNSLMQNIINQFESNQLNDLNKKVRKLFVEDSLIVQVS